MIFDSLDNDNNNNDNKKNPTWNLIFANLIQTTFGGDLKSNSNLICTDVSSLWTLWLLTQIGYQNVFFVTPQILDTPQIYSIHAYCPNGVSLRTRQGAREPQSQPNTLQHIWKFARHISSPNVPLVPAFGRCHTSCCIVKQHGTS